MDNENIIIGFCEDETNELLDKHLPDYDLLNYYNQRANRELFINYDVDYTCVDMAKQIIDWNKKDIGVPVEDRKTIKIYINTIGGDSTAMWSLINAIQLSQTKCVTIGIGSCSSAGAMILLAPKLENRYLFPNSTVLIHKGSSGVVDDVSKIINYAEFLKKASQVDKCYILSQTKISEDMYKLIEDKDWHVFADDCITHGIVGNIITDIDVINNL